MREGIRLVVIALAMLAATPARADSRIANLSATFDRGWISVRCVLDQGFEHPEVLNALRGGLPTGFKYQIELFRKRPNWFDERVGLTEVELVATFNSVTQEYLLNYRRDGRLVRSETFSDLVSLQRRMSTIDEVALFYTRAHAPSKLRVRVRADITESFFLYMIPQRVSTSWKETRVRPVKVN